MRNSELRDFMDMNRSSVASSLQFVTFMLGTELYGIDILKVEEIVGMSRINPVPDCPPWMKGVINMRGKVIPVIDMRVRFRMAAVDYTGMTVILVVSFREKSLGLIVDSVSDVNSIDLDLVQDSPHFGSDVETAVIRGICPVDGAPVVLLDLDKLLSVEDMALIEAGTVV